MCWACGVKESIMATSKVVTCNRITALCAERVTQMTKTYNDIEAVTHLLEEKERDLELAARIGQSLLERNKELNELHEEDEQQLAEARDQIAQLNHDVFMKDALLQAYVQDDNVEENESPVETAERTVTVLQKKTKQLQDENIKLKNEAGLLRQETEGLEEHEASLVSNCVGHMEELEIRVMVLQEDLAAKTDVTMRQQEEITSLMAVNIQFKGKNNKLVIENAELTQHLEAAKDAQHELVDELRELEERYTELSALYQEAQEEIKALRRKQKPMATPAAQISTFSPFLPADSLAMELQDTFRKVESPEPAKQRRSHSKRVMETARCVRRSSTRPMPGSSSNDSCESIAGSSTRSSLYLSEGESVLSDEYVADTDSLCSTPLAHKLGRPGIPGSNDLETALRRLSLRKANEINDRLFDDAQERKGQLTGKRPVADGSDSPTPCHTPDSLMSTGSGSSSNLSYISSLSARAYRRPQKLQIVKPLEGSLTLYQWQRLATPHLGGVLESRPGIQIKGQEPVSIPKPDFYSLSDVEEDDESDFSDRSDVFFQRRCSERTCGTYTYTTARVTFPSSTPCRTATLTVSTSARPAMTSMLQERRYKEMADTCSKDNGNSVVKPVFSTSECYAMGGYAVSPMTAPSQKMRDSPSGGTSVCAETETVNVMSTGILPISMSPLPPAALSLARSATAYTTDTHAFLNLAEKVKHLGLNNIINMATQAGLQPSATDPIDVGLNTIMGIKRRRGWPSAPTMGTPSQTQSHCTSKSSDKSEKGGVITRTPGQDNRCKQS